MKNWKPGVVAVLLAGLVLMAITFSAPWDQPVRAGRYMVASGHQLATRAGTSMLERGGNAFDAAVATCMALNVTRPISAGAVGVTPTLVWDAAAGKARSYCGLGPAPARVSAAYYRMQGWPFPPSLGVNSQLIPAGPDTWIALLKEYGTLSFAEAAEPAIRLAEDGHVLNRTCARIMRRPPMEALAVKIAWPYNYSILYAPFEPEGPQEGDVLVQKDLAFTLKILVEAEARELRRSGDRLKALEAVRAEFYEGSIARAIVKSQKKHSGAITLEDLKNFRGEWEEPVAGTFHGYTVYANPPWCQGPTVPMILQILEGIDLQALGHNSPEYVSVVAQAIELVFADREAYIGDPDFVDVPMNGLLSKEYAAERRKLIDAKRGFGRMPEPGDPWKYEGRPRPAKVYKPRPLPDSLPPFSFNRDTTYFCVVDARGNAVSMTPSDFPTSPMVEGYGLILGSRGSQFHYQKGHPARVEGGKRPRLTPNPSLVSRDGRLYMAYGTPGGDGQPQTIVQVFLNIIVFGLDPQAAINAPRFRSKNFPDSFSPHNYYPGAIQLDSGLAGIAPALLRMNFKVEVLDPASITMGAACAIIRLDDGSLIGGADPREEAWAEGK